MRVQRKSATGELPSDSGDELVDSGDELIKRVTLESSLRTRMKPVILALYG